MTPAEHIFVFNKTAYSDEQSPRLNYGKYSDDEGAYRKSGIYNEPPKSIVDLVFRGFRIVLVGLVLWGIGIFF